MKDRILGLDYGSKRIGVSMSDPLGVIAQPLDAIMQDANAFIKVQEIIRKNNINLCVVGMPLNLKGEKAYAASEVMKFIDQLRMIDGIEVVHIDERFTTTIAQQTMVSMGTKKKERRQRNGRIDSMAAAILLQSYLDRSKH